MNILNENLFISTGDGIVNGYGVEKAQSGELVNIISCKLGGFIDYFFEYNSFPIMNFIGATTVAIAAVAGTVAAYAVPIEDPEDPNKKVWVLIKKILVGLAVSVSVLGICYSLQGASEPPVDPVEAQPEPQPDPEHPSESSESEYDSDAGKCVGEAPTPESAYSLGMKKFSEDRLLQKLKDNHDLLPDGRVDHGEDATFELDTLFEELKSEGLRDMEGNMGQFMVTKELKLAFLKGYVEGTNEVIQKLGFPPYGSK